MLAYVIGVLGVSRLSFTHCYCNVSSSLVYLCELLMYSKFVIVFQFREAYLNL